MTRAVFRPYASAIVGYGDRHPEVVCLTGDLTTSCEIDLFRDRFPERYFNFGMAEQNILGIAGGMAKGGLLPVVHTFGVFLTRRAFDQVSMAIGVPRARVRLMGFLPGITTPGGVTHQAIDDVAMMASVPGMTVLDLGDATEIESALEAVHDVDGPVYCRVMRGDVPALFETPLVLGRARVLGRGNDLCLISASVTTLEAIKAAETLRAAGASVSHLHINTIKPCDDPVILEAMVESRGVITLENHLVRGGLGTVIAELIARHGIGRRLVTLGLQDTYAAGGTLPYLLRRFGMSAEAVVEAATSLFDVNLGSPAAGDAINPLVRGDESRQEAL
jgi:transketolase